MNLVEESQKISGRLQELLDKLYEDKAVVLKEKEKNLQDLKDASSKGDRSENAAFTAAAEKVSDLNIQESNISKQIAQIENLPMAFKYKSIGMVVLYTTMLLDIDGSKQYVFKLYPGGVSAIDKGILAADSRVGKAVWHKEKGDKFTITHNVTGEEKVYTILDLY